MKRRIFALLAALCLLAGCAGKTEPDAPAVDPAPPTVDPTPVTPTEPSEAEQAEARLRERIAGMSIEEKVGQMFFVRCPEMGAAEDVAAYHLGGLLLFGRDYKDADGGWLSAEELTAKLESYQAAAELPLFIGSDEEGGTVTRASRDPKLFAQPLPSPQELYAARGMDGLAAETLDYNKQLLALGINVNLAPVCDVSTDAGDFIYARSFGRDAAATSEFVTAAVGAIRDAGVAAVLKHFPGYGNNVDTHTGIAVDQRPLESFTSSDFLPFQAGMESGGGKTAVLVSHNIMTAVDGDLPASLSPKVHGLLRTDLGFDGVVMTDDLAMEAVAAYSADGAVAVMALEAGNDFVITTDYRTQIPKVLESLESGALSEETIDTACRRVLTWKQNLGLL